MQIQTLTTIPRSGVDVLWGEVVINSIAGGAPPPLPSQHPSKSRKHLKLER